jgi:hypothetical protein
MGTTLTGTTPQDTYDSLIKVTDNGPISGTLKALSDGLGNDSTLSLSTTAASIAGTLAVAGAATFDTTTLVVDATNNRVGVGTTAPNTTLSVVTSGAESTIDPILTAQTSTVTYGGLYAIRDGAGDQRGLLFQNYTANVGLTEKMRITSAGNVGIGTSTPANFDGVTLGDSILDVNGIIQARGDATNGVAIIQFGGSTYRKASLFTPVGTDVGYLGVGISSNGSSSVGSEIARFTPAGLTFNGDTAAANALDDYEEGTWTIGVTFGGAAVGVTTSSNTGTYTKIGRQVTVNAYLQLTSKGSSTGDAKLTGLPFTIASGNSFFSAASSVFFDITFANQFQVQGAQGSTTMDLLETSVLGTLSLITDVDFANNAGIVLSLTYFV